MLVWGIQGIVLNSFQGKTFKRISEVSKKLSQKDPISDPIIQDV
jgi:hypothetical protein